MNPASTCPSGRSGRCTSFDLVYRDGNGWLCSWGSAILVSDGPTFPDRHVHISPQLGFQTVDGVLPAHLVAVRDAHQVRESEHARLSEALLDRILEARKALYSFSEIALAMGCTHQNVMQTVDRGLKRRAEALQGDGEAAAPAAAAPGLPEPSA